MKEVTTLLKNRNFMHLWASQIISQVVINTLSFLLLIYLFEKTGSTIATSLIWVSYALPAVLFGPIAAVAADVVDKKKLLTWTLLIQALTVIAFSLLHTRFLYLAYGVVFTYSIANQFYVPAEAASLPLFVDKKNLPFANSLFFVTVQLGLTFGFLTAGIAYEYLGLSVSLIVGAILLLTAYSFLSLLPRIAPLEHLPKELSRGVASFIAELVEGYQFIKNTKRVLLPFLLLIGLQVSLSVIVVTLPAMAQNLLSVRPSLASIAIGVPAALGAVIATVVVSKVVSRGFSRKRVIEISLFTLSLALLILGAVVPHVHFLDWQNLGRSQFLCGRRFLCRELDSNPYSPSDCDSAGETGPCVWQHLAYNNGRDSCPGSFFGNNY